MRGAGQDGSLPERRYRDASPEGVIRARYGLSIGLLWGSRVYPVKDAGCFGGVERDLGAEFVQAREFAFAAQEGVEGDGEFAAVSSRRASAASAAICACNASRPANFRSPRRKACSAT